MARHNNNLITKMTQTQTGVKTIPTYATWMRV